MQPGVRFGSNPAVSAQPESRRRAHFALHACRGATTVVAVDTAPDKLVTAKHMGADEALVSGPDAVARIKHITHGRGASVVLDMVGIDPTLKMATQVAQTLGDVTIVGLGGGALRVNFFNLPHECTATAPYWGSIPELVEVVSLAQTGKNKMLVEHFRLDRAAEAYRLLHDGKIGGRAVITPND